jgi:hypothetical protein
VAKVTINGEVFDFDLSRKPLSEALAIENALKIPYAQYEEGLRAGSARSVAAFIWLVWRRDGRDVPLADILSGTVDVDLDTLEMDAGDDAGDEGSAGPTTPTPPPSSTTAAGTSARSRKSSRSVPGSGGS